MKVHLSGHAIPRHDGQPCDDAWIVRERGDTVVIALADGVGACREGGAGARRAVEMLADYYLARPRAWSPRRALAEFSTQINRQLYQESMERHGAPEMACTLTAIVIEGDRLYGCNIGDSPGFLWRQGRLTRLTEAHALTQPGMDHVLTRAVGLEALVEPHFFEHAITSGDVILACSDGITTVVDEKLLSTLLERRATAQSFAAAARDAAADKPEARDDISAVVLDVAEPGRNSSTERQSVEVLPNPRAGDVIDGHELVRSLAPGDRVWLANAPGGTRKVLKFAPPEIADSEVARDAFVREVWNATRLVSPDLVSASAPADRTLRYYTMEYIEAPTLRTALRDGRLGVEEARELARFLLRVGQFLLRHDLAHGDLKPENILAIRKPNGIAYRLLDLGSTSELFSVTSRAGTPSYLAPERFRGAAISERTEIFAIGVTLYEALTGHYPYGEIERFQTPRFDPPRPPTRFNPTVPPWLESIVLRAIDIEPERRYHYFSEMAYELENPHKVAAYHRKDAPLIERNPLLFYKVLSLVLSLLSLWLLLQLARK